MFNYLYQHWAFMSLPIAIFSTLILWCNASHIDPVVFWIWMLFPVYLLHQFEEHAYPGGFKDSINAQFFKLDPKGPLTDAAVFWINIPDIWLLFPLIAALSQLVSPKIGVLLPYFTIFNGALHVILAIVKKAYNPGLFTSLCLNIPIGGYALYLAGKENLLDTATNFYGIGGTLLLHLSIILYVVYKIRVDRRHTIK